ncbi:MAG: SEL1-like repeat protein, partial [Pseudorhodoplanes sp.]|nr:SEL1-like repeat protein [Pseudorhodoplanes sp.]
MRTAHALLAAFAVAAVPAATYGQAAKPAPAQKPQAQTPAPPAKRPAAVDLAFGAYQRGFYLTAFYEATKRVEEHADPAAMTLLGELYANGFGVKQDDAKAAEWYRLAA